MYSTSTTTQLQNQFLLNTALAKYSFCQKIYEEQLYVPEQKEKGR